MEKGRSAFGWFATFCAGKVQGRGLVRKPSEAGPAFEKMAEEMEAWESG